jgi:DNA-binding transcriptional regulator YhcF (GntR family)
MLEEKEKIIKVIQNSDRELSTREISEITGINWQKTKKTLMKLYKEKVVSWEKKKGRNLWKIEKNKKPFKDLKLNKERAEKIPEQKIARNKLSYILAIVMIYSIAGTTWLVYTKKEEALTNIIIWSISSFWVFFIGYYGWSLAKRLSESFKAKRKEEDEPKQKE